MIPAEKSTCTETGKAFSEGGFGPRSPPHEMRFGEEVGAIQ